MSDIVPNEGVLLQGLLNKVILYRFTRNLDKELAERKISHAQLSGSTGRNSNWFNRSFNELEDMRISTFIKSITVINKIISGNEKFKPVEVCNVLDDELFKAASVSIDLSLNDDVEHLLRNDTDIRNFFVDIRFYVDALEGKLSGEEKQAYERILVRINEEGT